MAVAHRLVEPRDIVSIEPMTDTEATALLARKLDGHLNVDELYELATVLEFMSLGITQAAAYIQRRAPRCSVREYIDQFNRNDDARTGLLSYEAGHLRRDHEAKNSIINSWQISFGHIRQRWPSAADLLSLMSFFDRQGFPEYVLTATRKPQQSSYYGSVTSRDKTFDMDIERLRKYSLVSVELDGHSFAMHRLVQLATRDWLVQHGQDQKQRVVFLEKLFLSFPPGKYEHWAVCEELLPHVSVAEVVRPSLNDKCMKQWVSILLRATMYALGRGYYLDAERLCHKSLSALEEAVHLDKTGPVSAWYLLSRIYLAQGRSQQAEELGLKVLDMNRVHVHFSSALYKTRPIAGGRIAANEGSEGGQEDTGGGQCSCAKLQKQSSRDLWKTRPVGRGRKAAIRRTRKIQAGVRRRTSLDADLHKCSNRDIQTTMPIRRGQRF